MSEPLVFEVVALPYFTDNITAGITADPTVRVGDVFVVTDPTPDEDGDLTGRVQRTGDEAVLSTGCLERIGGVIKVSTLQKFYEGTGMTALETSAILALLRAMESR